MRGGRLVWGVAAFALFAALALRAAAPVSGAGTCPCSLFDASATPTLTGQTDPHPVELGVKFAVDAPVRLTTIRFYKDAAETGSHVGRIWGGGTELAQASFGSETGSGWQEATLATPLLLSPGTTYTASVGFNQSFVITQNALGSEIVNGPLRSIADGSNGVYNINIGQLPTDSYLNSNYFVDVVVEELEPPTATVSPADGATGVAITAAPSAVFSRDLDAATVTGSTFTLEGPGGAVAASVSYDGTTRTATLTPSAALANATTYTARLDETVTADDGVALGTDLTWSFTTEAAPPPPPPPSPLSPSPPPAAPAPAPNPHADVELTMTATPGNHVVGADVTYTLTATNLGPATATGVVVTDDLPSGITLRGATSTSGSCTTTPAIRCDLGALAAGQSARMTVAVAATASGEVENVAAVSAGQPDPNARNNRASLMLSFATRVIPVAEAGIRVTIVRTRLSANRTDRLARTWVAVDASALPFRPLRLQLAPNPETPWAWRSFIDRFSFRSRRPEIWIRLSDGTGTVTEWQPVRFAAAVAARSRR